MDYQDQQNSEKNKLKKPYQKPQIDTVPVYETGALACNKPQGICFPRKVT